MGRYPSSAAREHIIAGLSVNHVERYVLLCGYTAQRTQHDYGTDLNIYTYDRHGEVEPGFIYVQVKATDDLRVLQDGSGIPFRLDRADLLLWLNEPMPVILVLYDARTDEAYWLYVQAYFERLGQRGSMIGEAGRSLTVYFDKSQRLDDGAIRQIAQYKANVLWQGRGVIHEYR